MPFLLLVIYPAAEIIAYYEFISHYSFWDALTWCFVSGILGLTVMMLQGRGALIDLQTSLLQGKLPSHRVVHRAVMMFAGLLILLPGLISDVVGFLLILPGIRHLFVYFVTRKFLSRAIGNGAFVFRFGGFNAAGRSFDFQNPEGSFEEKPLERDAEVIDIESKRIESSKKKPE